MAFGEGRIKEEKVFGDVVFPKTLLPCNASMSSVENLAEMVSRERDSLTKTLRLHGAILFRGFDVRSADEFERVVVSFGWEKMEHMGATTRIKLTDRVYTANEAPVDKLINFHHEMSLMKQSPSKIFFFCKEPAPEGGATSIVPSHVVVEKMEERLPEFVAKISEVGLVARFKTAKDNDADSGVVINKTWKWLFKTEDEVEAEKRARQILHCSFINFKSDGSAEFVYGPTNPIREFGGKRVWFMPLLGYTDKSDDTVDNSFGDGNLLPREAMTTYSDILEENCVDVKWQKGDILLVDNLAVQHARKPGKPPRVIFASICK